MTNHIRKTLFILSALMLLLSAGTFADTLVSSVDRSNVNVDETLTLHVRYTGNGNGNPDFSALNHDFEILSQSQSNQYRNINGMVEAFTEWTLILFPKQPGRLVIPSFKHNGVFSDAIEINVSQSAPLPSGQKDVVFLETVVDSSDVYVQQEINLTFRFYYSVSVDGLDRPDMALDNTLIEELPRADYQRNINGVPYNVAEFRYALFPQTSGSLEIPAMNWTAKISQSPRRSIFDLNNGRFELKRLRTETKTIQVAPRPANFPAGAAWLPSSKVTLEEQWSKDPSQFKVGEPITRTLTLHAKGLMASQLPKLGTDPSDSRLKYYADQPELNDAKENDGYTGERTEKIAVVVSEGGMITVPEISIPWLDTTTNEIRYATLPERQFLVAAASDEVQNNRTAREKAQQQASEAITPPPENSNTAQTSQSAQKTSGSKLLLWFIIVLGLLCVGLARVVLLQQRKINRLQMGTHKPAQPITANTRTNENAAWKVLQQSCSQNAYAEVRRAMLEWSKARWPEAHIHALADIARQINDNAVSVQLQALDHAMYGASDQNKWEATALLQALSAWSQKQKQQNSGNAAKLAPLYS